MKYFKWDLEILRDFLQTSPLHHSITFEDRTIATYDNIKKAVTELSLFCPNCKRERLFHSPKIEDRPISFGQHTPIYLPQSDFIELSLFCSKDDCKLNKKIWLHYSCATNLQEENNTPPQVTLTKCGEWPTISPRIDVAIQRTFPDSADLLKKGVVCLNEGYGVGAFAYFRQVLEPQIDLLLQEVEIFATATNDTAVMEKITALRKESPMSDKIAIAKDALPAILQVDGVNPLGTIYGCLSEDIHQGTDEECLQKAQDIYSSLSFILQTLANFKKSRNEYAESLKSLQRRKGR